MGQRDEIGMRGEALFTAAIMSFCGRTRPYFVSHFLGDKFRTLDFIVELVDAEPGTPYLFVQVKTTTQGYTSGKGPKRLRIRLEAEDVTRMREYLAPTYLAGVDLNEERVFILSINEITTSSVSGMPTSFPSDCGNVKRLWEEVNAFWKARDMRMMSSVFSV
ncbi:DUF4365 domain-containing protein [Singulisphaera rosea]